MKETAQLKSEALSAVARGLFAPCLVKEDDGWHARWRGTEDAENPWIDRFVREAVATPLAAEAEREAHPTVHDAWLAALKSRTGLVNREDRECAAFAEVLERWIDEGVDSPEAKRSIEFSFKPAKGGGVVSCPAPRGEKPLRALGRATAVFAPLRRLELSKDAYSLYLRQSSKEKAELMKLLTIELLFDGQNLIITPHSAFANIINLLNCHNLVITSLKSNFYIQEFVKSLSDVVYLSRIREYKKCA